MFHFLNGRFGELVDVYVLSKTCFPCQIYRKAKIQLSLSQIRNSISGSLQRVNSDIGSGLISLFEYIAISRTIISIQRTCQIERTARRNQTILTIESITIVYKFKGKVYRLCS